MKARPSLQQKKYARVISLFAGQMSMSLDEALDYFYHSMLYQQLRDGASYLHSMSEEYLEVELESEYREQHGEEFE